MLDLAIDYASNPETNQIGTFIDRYGGNDGGNYEEDRDKEEDDESVLIGGSPPNPE